MVHGHDIVCDKSVDSHGTHSPVFQVVEVLISYISNIASHRWNKFVKIYTFLILQVIFQASELNFYNEKNVSLHYIEKPQNMTIWIFNRIIWVF